jgi:hypothetical protein
LLAECFSQLAAKHSHSRFVKIISTECIAGYPDANLPTVLIYHEGKCVKTLAGLAIWGGKRASAECVQPIAGACNLCAGHRLHVDHAVYA